MSTKTNSYNIVKLVSLKMIKEEGFRNYESIASQQCIVDLMKKYMANEYREVAYVIGCDIKNRPTLIHQLGIGGIDRCIVPIPSILKPLLLSNCSTAFLVHNHPADSMVPSEADIKLTNRVREVMKLMEMTLLDHLIVNSDCSDSYSMRNSIYW